MKVIAHTPYGVFESKEIPEDQLYKVEEILNNIHKMVNYRFPLSNDNVIFFTKEMIAKTLFILEN